MNGNADVVAQLDVALEDEQDVHEGGEEESDPDKTSRLRHASSTCPSLHPDVGTHRYIKRDPEFLLYVYCVVLYVLHSFQFQGFALDEVTLSQMLQNFAYLIY